MESNASGPDEPSAGTGTDQVYRRLREAILRGELTPGLRISQLQLSRELGVSRTPLREAVRMLQREGLIDGEANRMVHVGSISSRDIEELYAVRIVNESLAIRLSIPHMSSHDDAVLADSLGTLARLVAEGDLDAWEVAHRGFHTELVKYAGERLSGLLSELSDHSERYRRLYITSQPRAFSVGAAEHEAIAEACHRRDATQAAHELARHLSRTALASLMEIAPEHEPSMVRSALRAVLGSGGTGLGSDGFGLGPGRASGA